MVFSSTIFVFLFLPIVLILSLLVRTEFRNAFLVLASLVFYSWGAVQYTLLLVFLVACNWLIGVLIDLSDSQARKKALLVVSILITVGGLVYFKYTNFIIDNANTILAPLGTSLPHVARLELPLGISFFTFHLLSYVIDIYRGVAPAQKSPINFALYICFFPQMIAGPIIRYHDVASQLTDRQVTFDKFASGLERFILGLGKKVMLANPFGQVADRVFALSASDLSQPVAWFGLLSYAIQLYFDFSGYSDMAIGLGRMFGFEYLENFNYPFISKSISEFWRRWHISLSNWFRDYLYMPLVFVFARRAARRHGPQRRKFDDRPQLVVVFLICGIWHGANWTFVIWGAIHGLFLVLERGRLGLLLKKLPPVFSHLYVLAVIMLAWVFFRADSVSAALVFLKAMAGFSGEASAIWPLPAFIDTRIMLTLPIALLALTPIFSSLARDWKARALQAFGQLAPAGDGEGEPTSWLDRSLLVVRPPFLMGILVVSMIYVAGQAYNPFIYFRF
jgi:alginate O-acetyltransferase complex protein AlgI